MDRVLLTCPSRNRPHRLKEMLASFRKTRSPGTDMVVYLDDDDPLLAIYEKGGAEVEIGKRMNVAQIHNHLVKTHPGYDYYMPVNDDIIFQTPAWDKILIETIKTKGDGWGIAYGCDTNGQDRFRPFPTFGMISSKIPKTLGYLYPPQLLALFGDTYLNDFGRAIGKLFYCPEVIIEHIRVIDDPNDPRATRFFEDKERQAYADYIDQNLDQDIRKVFDAICMGV